MAEPNVALLLELYDAFNRRDIDALMKDVDSEIEVEETEDLGYAALLLRVLGPRFVILSGRYRGRDELRRLFESVWEIAEWFEVEPHDSTEIGDSVVVPLLMRAKAKHTGVEGEAAAVHLWTMRDGKAIGLRVYATVDEAVSAAKAALEREPR